MDTTAIKGHLIVLMAPTGSGKGTVTRSALRAYPELYVTVSGTTRAMRPGEEDGREYHFLSNEEFDAKVENGEFLEWAVFGGNKYGTLKSEITPRLAECNVVICEVELQGVEQLMELLPREHMTIVYIDAGGWENLRARAIARAPMSEEELAARHERYLIERKAKHIADVVIDNSSNDAEAAAKQFIDMVEKSYKKCKETV